MVKKTKKLGKTEAQMSRWIEEENLKTQAKRIKSRINETVLKAEADFWEIIMGSFPEVANINPPFDLSNGFSKACCDAVMSWFIANANPDAKMLGLLKSESIKPREKKAIIGQNEQGWWAANPEPAIKAQDIDKAAVIISMMPSRAKLLKLLTDLGYKNENIAEGILKQ